MQVCPALFLCLVLAFAAGCGSESDDAADRSAEAAVEQSTAPEAKSGARQDKRRADLSTRSGLRSIDDQTPRRRRTDASRGYPDSAEASDSEQVSNNADGGSKEERAVGQGQGDDDKAGAGGVAPSSPHAGQAAAAAADSESFDGRAPPKPSAGQGIDDPE